MSDLHHLSAVEALALFRARGLSPVELMEATIARAEEVEPTINAFAFTHFERALEQAREAEARYMSGHVRPLEGLPVAIKDEVPIEGAGRIGVRGLADPRRALRRPRRRRLRWLPRLPAARGAARPRRRSRDRTAAAHGGRSAVKLTLLGAGVRAPFVLRGLATSQDVLELDEVVLHDADAERLELMTALGAHLSAGWGARFAIRGEPDAGAAIDGARLVFAAIRPGQERARVVDEEVPLALGVLGQETTGPGGFAMALRTVPAMLGYARLIEERAPDALLVMARDASEAMKSVVASVAACGRRDLL